MPMCAQIGRSEKWFGNHIVDNTIVVFDGKRGEIEKNTTYNLPNRKAKADTGQQHGRKAISCLMQHGTTESQC